jgi:hypothetical protein
MAYEDKIAKSGVSHSLTLERTGIQRPAIGSALSGSKYLEMVLYESKTDARGVIVPRVRPQHRTAGARRGGYMLKTTLCRQLGNEYPLFSAGLGGGMAGPELVAAVSNAGACGVLGRGGCPHQIFVSRFNRRVYSPTSRLE